MKFSLPLTKEESPQTDLLESPPWAKAHSHRAGSCAEERSRHLGLFRIHSRKSHHRLSSEILFSLYFG
jgi:hypothetical protein